MYPNMTMRVAYIADNKITSKERLFTTSEALSYIIYPF